MKPSTINFNTPAKFIIYLPVLLFFMSFRGLGADIRSAPLELPSKEVLATMTKEQKEDLVQQMKERTEAIRAMDKSQLTKEDRKALRAELKSMKKEARAVTGVYISVGALIIIILLLIIII
jgi:hypothetical protein